MGNQNTCCNKKAKRGKKSDEMNKTNRPAIEKPNQANKKRSSSIDGDAIVEKKYSF